MKKILFSLFLFASLSTYGNYDRVIGYNLDITAAEEAFISGEYSKALKYYSSAEGFKEGILFPKDRHNMFLSSLHSNATLDELATLISVMKKEGFKKSYFHKSHTILDLAKKNNLDILKMVDQIYVIDETENGNGFFDKSLERLAAAENQYHSKKISRNELNKLYNEILATLEQELNSKEFYHPQKMGIPFANDTLIDYTIYKKVFEKAQSKIVDKEVISFQSDMIENGLKNAFENGNLTLDMYLQLTSKSEIKENFSFNQPVVYNGNYYIFLPNREELENNRRKLGLSVTPQYLNLTKFAIKNPNTIFIHNIQLGNKLDKDVIKNDEYVKVE